MNADETMFEAIMDIGNPRLPHLMENQPTKPTRLAIYARTSTDKQETGLEAQLMACRAYCEREGIAPVAEFSDDGVSGALESRPALDQLLAKIRNKELDGVLVYALSRLSRSVVQSHLLLGEFKRMGVQLLSCTETVDSDTPEGKLLYGILAVVNEYQREDIVRKVKNGLENARKKGIRLGRQRENDYEEILKMLDSGLSQRHVAKTLGVSRGAVLRAVRSRKV